MQGKVYIMHGLSVIMWFFNRKKQKESENQEKIVTILSGLSDKFDKLEENYKKLKGFTYRKAKIIGGDDEEEEEKEDTNMVYNGVSLKGMGIPASTLEWIKREQPV